MISYFILIIAIYLFTYCFIRKQDYINVSVIIKKQLLSIIKIKTERRRSDIVNFINIYIIPLFLSFLVSLENIIKRQFYDNIIVILSILVSVFLTLISILTSKTYKNKTEKQKIIVKQTFLNVYFLTIISTILLILCFLKISIQVTNTILINNFDMILKYFNIIFNTIVVYLILEIIIHLLIVLKRIEQIFIITFED